MAVHTARQGTAGWAGNRSHRREPSVLVDFDTGYVLDALSFAIIVLDKQLCVIYANVVAQDLLALDLSSLRGRPLAHFLPQWK